MLKKSRVILAAVLAVALASLLAGQARAATTPPVMVQTFSGANGDGSSILGTVQISSLATGATVTGSGTLTLVFNGTTVYSGGFTATTIKSLTPNSASGFTPIVAITPASTTVVEIGPYGPLITSTPMSISNGPATTTGLAGSVQLTGLTCATTYESACTTAGVPATQDLLLYFAQARTTVDIGITLTGAVTGSGGLALLANGGVSANFPSLTGTSTGLIG
jgi:hypothetical protein